MTYILDFAASRMLDAAALVRGFAKAADLQDITVDVILNESELPEYGYGLIIRFLDHGDFPCVVSVYGPENASFGEGNIKSMAAILDILVLTSPKGFNPYEFDLTFPNGHSKRVFVNVDDLDERGGYVLERTE